MKIKNLKILIILIIVSGLFLSFTQIKKEVHLKINKQNLQGAWGGDEETENAYFGIFGDSVYYPDPNIWEKIELKNDTILFIDNENHVENHLLILKLTTDSLILFNFECDIILRLNKRGQ